MMLTDVTNRGGRLYDRSELLKLAKLDVRDKTCPSGHSAGRSRQHLAVGELSILVCRNGATYLTFAAYCRNGGCDYTSAALAVRLPS